MLLGIDGIDIEVGNPGIFIGRFMSLKFLIYVCVGLTNGCMKFWTSLFRDKYKANAGARWYSLRLWWYTGTCLIPLTADPCIEKHFWHWGYNSWVIWK